jgi:hypothetical protein
MKTALASYSLHRTVRTASIAFATVVLGIGATARADSFYPAAPKAFEPVTLTIDTISQCRYIRGVRQENGRLVVTLPFFEPCGSPPPPVQHQVALGRLPAGIWTIDIREGPATRTLTLTVAENEWTEAESPGNVIDVAGVWGMRDHSGHGVTVSISPDRKLAGLVFTYAADGRPQWLSLQQGTIDPFGGFWRGDAYITRGTDFLRPDRPGDPSYTKVADAELDLGDGSHGSLCLRYVEPNPAVESVCLELVRYPFY